MKQAQIGLIGLAVMGENLVLNLESKGFSVAVYNRNTERVDNFWLPEPRRAIIGAHSVEELVSKVQSPRKIMLMIKAGDPVDQMIESLIPLLEAGDTIIDGGTQLGGHRETSRLCGVKGLLYIGTGVSGGEEGALLGLDHARRFEESLARPQADASRDQRPCRRDSLLRLGRQRRNGHFVKMVHNGIEYGDMQLICEVYDIQRRLLGLSNKEMHKIFAEWNEGELDSYLIEITKDILAYQEDDGTFLVDKILDAAGQKGTGKWTGISALHEGVPLTLIVESVFARSVSALKEQRVAASKVFDLEIKAPAFDKKQVITQLQEALFAAKIISYAQGFDLIKTAGITNKWDLDLGGIAQLWRGGCIIRSRFLGKITEAYRKNPDLPNLILDAHFAEILKKNHQSLRAIVALAAQSGIPTPSLSAALSWFDSYRTERLPANLLQAQRDYFGAHTYERTDRPRGEFFHTNWTGRGGSTASTIYSI